MFFLEDSNLSCNNVACNLLGSRVRRKLKPASFRMTAHDCSYPYQLFIFLCAIIVKHLRDLCNPTHRTKSECLRRTLGLSSHDYPCGTSRTRSTKVSNDEKEAMDFIALEAMLNYQLDYQLAVDAYIVSNIGYSTVRYRASRCHDTARSGIICS
jgi:hypothetical protein